MLYLAKAASAAADDGDVDDDVNEKILQTFKIMCGKCFEFELRVLFNGIDRADIGPIFTFFG